MSNNGNAAAKFSYEEFDLKHIFQVAEQILVKREPGQYGRSEGAGFFTGIMDQYGSTISDVSREMTCKLSESEDEKTCKILKGTLRNHSWKAKMVIAVAALALKCGKHIIIPSQLPDLDKDDDYLHRWSKNQPHKSGENSIIIKSICLIQRLHIITDQIDKSKPRLKWLKGLQDFVQPMMNLARYILDNKLGDDQISKDDIQWIIKSAVVCSSQITVAHLLLLSNREKLFEIHCLKLKDLTETVEKSSKLWEIAQTDRAK